MRTGKLGTPPPGGKHGSSEVEMGRTGSPLEGRTRGKRGALPHQCQSITKHSSLGKKEGGRIGEGRRVGVG